MHGTTAPVLVLQGDSPAQSEDPRATRRALGLLAARGSGLESDQPLSNAAMSKSVARAEAVVVEALLLVTGGTAVVLTALANVTFAGVTGVVTVDATGPVVVDATGPVVVDATGPVVVDFTGVVVVVGGTGEVVVVVGVVDFLMV